MKQYTIRKIPDYLDKAVRERAKKTNASINSILVEALKKGLSVHEEAPVYNDMDDLAGTWVQDPETDAVLEEFDKIDQDMWK
jgi:plasmid stability protein